MRKRHAAFFELPRYERFGAFAMLGLSAFFGAFPFISSGLLAARLRLDAGFAIQASLVGAVAFDGQKSGKAAAAQPFRFDPNAADFDAFVALGLSERLANQILNYREKGGFFRRPDDFSKIYGLPQADFDRLRPFIFIANEADNQPRTSPDGPSHAAVRAPFSFDPNAATEADFERLGLPERVARSILNYREKGGFFRKKADFAKIYTLSPADFARLEPFIDLPAAVEKESPSASFLPNSTFRNPHSAFEKSLPEKIDVNAATLEDWKSLPGIGDFFAQKIMRFREALGGFAAVAQVAETRNLPDSVFQKAKPFLILEKPVPRKIRLNSATSDELQKHPLLDRRAAEALVSFRENHGPFKNIDDLRAVRAISPDLLKKLEPYLGLE